MTLSPGYASPLYYRYSGQFSAVGLVIAILASLAAAVVLGAVYAYIDMYNPCLSVLTFFATVGFGMAVGWVSGWLLRWGRVRNNAVIVVVAVAVALFALYASWVFWIYALIQKAPDAQPFNPGRLATHPLRLWDLVQEINSIGVWSIGGHAGSSSSGAEPVKGPFLWVVWFAESVLVVGASVWATVKVGTTLPYCETCQKWCAKGKRLFSTPPADPQELKQHLESKDFAYLIALGPGQPLPSKWFEVYLHSCDQCRELNALTVNAVSMQLNRKGQQQKKEQPVVDKLLLTPKELATLTTLKDQYLARKQQPASPAPNQLAPTEEPAAGLEPPPET